MVKIMVILLVIIYNIVIILVIITIIEYMKLLGFQALGPGLGLCNCNRQLVSFDSPTRGRKSFQRLTIGAQKITNTILRIPYYK